MKYLTKIVLAALAVCVLAGCEDSAVKAERLRLEALYNLDNLQVAKSLATNIYNNGESYRAIQRECNKEKESNVKNGKWCEKFNAIDKMQRGM